VHSGQELIVVAGHDVTIEVNHIATAISRGVGLVCAASCEDFRKRAAGVLVLDHVVGTTSAEVQATQERILAAIDHMAIEVIHIPILIFRQVGLVLSASRTSRLRRFAAGEVVHHLMSLVVVAVGHVFVIKGGIFPRGQFNVAEEPIVGTA
jgi:hypothetical protein